MVALGPSPFLSEIQISNWYPLFGLSMAGGHRSLDAANSYEACSISTLQRQFHLLRTAHLRDRHKYRDCHIAWLSQVDMWLCFREMSDLYRLCSVASVVQTCHSDRPGTLAESKLRSCFRTHFCLIFDAAASVCVLPESLAVQATAHSKLQSAWVSHTQFTTLPVLNPRAV